MSGAGKPEPALRDRLTVVEQVYHRPAGSDPTLIETRFTRELETVEQVYRRQRVATEEWQPLDHGWVERVGMIIIQNEEGKSPRLVPSEEERRETAQRVIELTDERSPATVWLVPPGESFRGYPQSVEGLVLRCRRGTARYTVHAVPG